MESAEVVGGKRVAHLGRGHLEMVASGPGLRQPETEGDVVK